MAEEAMTTAEDAREEMGKKCAAFLAAGGVNVLIVATLLVLNAKHEVIPRLHPKAAPAVVLIKRDEAPEPDIPPPEVVPNPEVPIIDLDQIKPRAITLEPVEVESVVPDISKWVVSRAKDDKKGLAHSMDDVDGPPGDLSIIRPEYPRVARMRGVEGLVVVKLLIDEHGRVKDVQVLKVEGDAVFEDAVLRVARKWKFSPARYHGRPVAVWGIKRIRFQLED